MSKEAFAEGDETANFLDDILSQCLVDGWMNETIGSFTCTTDCDVPPEYVEVFNHTLSPSMGTQLNTTFE